jgi:hypothetical protein
MMHALRTGRLYILDLASGAGPASLGLLSALAELRLSGRVPSFPLNVVVEAADLNTECLDLFRDMSRRIESLLEGTGIHPTWKDTRWDATHPLSTRDLLSRVLDQCGSSDLLVLVSLVSGTAGNDEEYKKFRSSFEQIKLAIIDRGTLLWTEPGQDNKRGRKLIAKLLDLLEDIGIASSRSTRDSIDIQYQWFEPFSAKSRNLRIAALLVRRGAEE